MSGIGIERTLGDMLAQAPALAARLQELLASEFEQLKLRDVTALEALQGPKTEVLSQLNQVAQLLVDLPTKPQQWLDVQSVLEACAQAHLRNVKLMQRQLDAVKGALQALQGDRTAASVDLYDRMGQVARRSGALMYQTA